MNSNVSLTKVLRNKYFMITASAIIVILILAITMIISKADQNASITYRAHVAYYGWLDWQTDGTTAGTTGESRRMEAIKIKLTGDYSGDVVYQSYVRDIGWQDEVRNSETSGVEGQSKQIEAIKIRLEGDVSTKYNVLYRVHMKNKGWQEWVSNGAMAGSDTESLRIEAIEIKLEKLPEEQTDATVTQYENNRGQVTTLTDDEFTTFVCIIFAEAGAEPYEAKLGVANVILNRMYDSRYPNTLEGVIYQKSQFSPAGNGILAREISNYKAGGYTLENHLQCIEAAKEAMAGHNNMGDRIGFMTPSALERYYSGQYRDKLVISNTAFFNI